MCISCSAAVLLKYGKLMSLNFNTRLWRNSILECERAQKRLQIFNIFTSEQRRGSRFIVLCILW